MKHRRSGHYKLKAPRGAYSDRHGPRIVERRPADAAPPAEPWRQDWPAFGVPALVIIDNGAAFRRP